MANFKATFAQSEGMKATFSSSGTMAADFGSVIFAGGSNVKVATTAEWNAKPTLIGEKNVVYVYSDWSTDASGNPIPAFKVGDGLAYLIDAPFNSDIAAAHISDSSIHVTDEEKAFWNQKVTAFLDYENVETLVLSSTANIGD